MRLKSILCTVAVCALVLTACGESSDTSSSTTSSTTSAAATTTPAYASSLQSLIEQTMKDNVIPGAVVHIESPDQGTWTQAFGTGTIGEDAPVSVDDHFRIGSNTKTMTVTVILQLAQEGKLSLDDPVSKYVDGVPNGDQITIAQLAEMRSGLYSYTFDPGFDATLDNDPQKAWTPQELLDIAFSHPVDFAPGEQFEYSNTNTVLLGVIIEQLTGMSVAEAFQERIFDPVGLAQTSFPANTDSSIPDPHPNGYSFGSNVSTIETYALPQDEQQAALDGDLLPNDETNANPSWTFTAGAGISNVGDMATYVKELVSGGMLDPQMQQTRIDSIQPTDPANPANAGYGLGIARFGPDMLGHDGQIPGYSTFMGQDPKTGLVIVIGTNLATVPTGEGSALVLLRAILPTFYGAGAVPGGDPARVSTTAPATPTS
ncbi:MAG TPA: serine hydrolase domain-containing protein [Aldersonia sp.]